VNTALIVAKTIPRISSLISAAVPETSEIINTPRKAPKEHIISHFVTVSFNMYPASRMTTIGLRLKIRLHLLTSIYVRAYENEVIPIMPTITHTTIYQNSSLFIC